MGKSTISMAIFNSCSMMAVIIFWWSPAAVHPVHPGRIVALRGFASDFEAGKRSPSGSPSPKWCRRRKTASRADVIMGCCFINIIQTSFWLVVWNILYFSCIGNNNPNWLSYSLEGLKPTTSHSTTQTSNLGYVLMNGCLYPLVNIQEAIENGDLCLMYPLKMVMFYSHVSLPEGSGLLIANRRGDILVMLPL